jgi:hypothetical protein
MWPNGGKYVGQFQDGKFKGQSSEYSPDGTVIRSGSWSAGNFLGVGIPLIKDHGAFIVPVMVNDSLTLNFTVDSGAADVGIPRRRGR